MIRQLTSSFIGFSSKTSHCNMSGLTFYLFTYLDRKSNGLSHLLDEENNMIYEIKKIRLSQAKQQEYSTRNHWIYY